MKISDKISNHIQLDDEIREYFYPKLYLLLNEGKINKGHYNKSKKAEDIITINSFGINRGDVWVSVDIYWGGDIYDQDTISMTQDEWNLLNRDEKLNNLLL